MSNDFDTTVLRSPSLPACLSGTTLTTPQAAAYLGLAPRTLEQWRRDGIGPRWAKLNRAVRYRRLDLDEFVEQNLRANTIEQTDGHVH